MRVLGIETSCDETGVAIYDANEGLLANALYSQTDIHKDYGGVVPELASRDHVRKIIPLIQEVMDKSATLAPSITGVAYTSGPGLAGALLVGACVGHTLAFSWGVPALGINHLEGHLLAPMLEENPPSFPFIALLVSGGHTQLIKVAALGQYDILGETVDDAAGEAFDKTAKLLGLGYPGGARLEALALKGNPTRFHFPRPMIEKPGLNMSFSGLKTFAATTIASHTLNDQTRADIALAFQEAVIETLTIKCQRAMQLTGYKNLVIAGGVGANASLRVALQKMMAAHSGKIFFPRHDFCTDNGAMIAYVGCQRFLAGDRQDLAIKVYPRWPLSEL